MSVIQVEAFDLPLSPDGASPFVLRDGDGRLFVDPLLLGLTYGDVLALAFDHEIDVPECRSDNVTFIELEWLLPQYAPNKIVFPEENRKRAKLIKRYCLDCVAKLQRRTMEVVFFEGSENDYE